MAARSEKFKIAILIALIGVIIFALIDHGRFKNLCVRFFKAYYEPETKFKFERTIFTPTLKTKIDYTKNYIYCASFQDAWNRLRTDVTGDTVEAVRTSDPTLAVGLNSLADVTGIIADDYHVSLAGKGGNGVAEKISAAVSKKFNVVNDLGRRFDSDETVVFSKFKKCVELEYPFYDTPTEPMAFADPVSYEVWVNWYGIHRYINNIDDMKRMAGQIDILYMKPTDYDTRSIDEIWPGGIVIQIKTKNTDEVLIIANVGGSTIEEVYIRAESLARGGQKPYYKKPFKSGMKTRIREYVKLLWTTRDTRNSLETGEIEKYPNIAEIIKIFDQDTRWKNNSFLASGYFREFRAGSFDEISSLTMKEIDAIFDYDEDKYEYFDAVNLVKSRIDGTPGMRGKFREGLQTAIDTIVSRTAAYRNCLVEADSVFRFAKIDAEIMKNFRMPPALALDSEKYGKVTLINEIDFSFNAAGPCKIPPEYNPKLAVESSIPKSFTCDFIGSHILYLKKKSASAPYFMMVINNSELLETVDPEKIFPPN